MKSGRAGQPGNLAQTRYLINGRFLGQAASGVQRYGHELLVAMDSLLLEQGEIAENWQVAVPFGTVGIPRLRSIGLKVLAGPKGHLWDQTAFAYAARGQIAIGLAGSGPILKASQVVVIHDAAPYLHPEFFRRAYWLTHRLLGRFLSLRAAQIATVSRSSASDLSRFIHRPVSALSVIPNGGDHVFAVSHECPAQTVDQPPFFLILGNLSPNKNVETAVRALEALPSTVRLSVVGRSEPRVFGPTSLEASDRVCLLGRLEDRDVYAMMVKAKALVFPSFYEGFGIPALEAMTMGCLVVASDIPPLRELCGDVALYFNPRSSTELAERMLDVLAMSESEQNSRREIGILRAKQFTWQNSALKLISLARSIAS